jgi:hypothetical protein
MTLPGRDVLVLIMLRVLTYWLQWQGFRCYFASNMRLASHLSSYLLDPLLSNSHVSDGTDLVPGASWLSRAQLPPLRE